MLGNPLLDLLASSTNLQEKIGGSLKPIIDKFTKLTSSPIEMNIIGGGGSSGSPRGPITGDKKLKYNTEPIMGLPPADYLYKDDPLGSVVKNRLLASMFVIYVSPMWPSYQGINGDTGMNLFELDSNKGLEKFNEILKSVNIKSNLVSNEMMFAIINDSSITDSFSNDYSDSMFESLANTAADFAKEARAISGGDTAAEIISKGGKQFSDMAKMFGSGKDSGSVVGNIFNDAGNTMAKMTESSAEFLRGLQQNISLNENPGVRKLGTGLMQIATGSQVDFPKIWRGSSYTPSRSFTIRLINPYPNNPETYMRYIVSPLVHLLSITLPISDSAFTFSHPLVCKVNCPGAFNLNCAAISNLEIVLGGETNTFSYYQRPEVVDVRVTFESLYTSMLAKPNNSDNQSTKTVNEERPTLDTYIKGLLGTTSPPPTNYASTIVNHDGSVQTYEFSKELEDLLYSSVNNVTNNSNLSGSYEVGQISQNRLPIDSLQAAFSTIGMKVEDLSAEALAAFNTIRSTITGVSVDLPTSIARLLENEIPVPLELENWFWNNYENFSGDVQTIVRNVIPAVNSLTSSIRSFGVGKSGVQSASF